MIEVDQMREYTDDEINLGRAVNFLVSALYNKNGTPKDIADKQGREALRKTIESIPTQIPANLREEDVKLLKATIEECRETRKMMKDWFWWIIGALFLASGTIALCAVMLLR